MELNKAIKIVKVHCEDCDLREYQTCVECQEEFAEAIDIVLKELDKAKDLNNELQIRYQIEHEKYLKEKEKWSK